ncbi:uncharacterized protein LOC135484907 [Lineus longissimus]|uniref:uncharacterized protein LOC135484907 n=1 Tax=Lineus longissimus TaxID=88925 RepID=UPI002B4C70A4
MSSLKHVKDVAKFDDMHRIVNTSSAETFLCYSKFLSASESLVFGVSDGIDVWQVVLDKAELEEMKDLANISHLDAYLGKFRSAFLSNQIDVSQVGTKIILTVGQGTSAFSYDLYEMKSAEKTTELQALLFKFAEKVSSLETQLKNAQQNVDTLSKQNKGGSTGFLDFDSGKKTGAKVQPKKAGMSVINPSSKKRKAAQGVVFD